METEELELQVADPSASVSSQLHNYRQDGAHGFLRLLQDSHKHATSSATMAVCVSVRKPIMIIVCMNCLILICKCSECVSGFGGLKFNLV